MDAASFADWIPTMVWASELGPAVRWRPLGNTRFDGTNFGDLFPPQLETPSDGVESRRTSLDELEALAASVPALPLAGMVAHMTRCGSTLVGKMLAGSGRVRVVSEAAPIDHVLRLAQADPSIDEETTIRRLRAMVAVFGRPRDRESHYVLKLDGWQTADLSLLERAFPQTPWFYLYRDPTEVLVSQVDSPSMLMSAMHAHATIGLPLVEAIQLSRVELCARVLERLGQNAIAAGATAGRLVDYAELPEAAVTRIAPAFGLPLDETSVAAMGAMARPHAKRPGEIFASDVASKRDRATPEIRDAVERWLAPVDRRLRALREA